MPIESFPASHADAASSTIEHEAGHKAKRPRIVTAATRDVAFPLRVGFWCLAALLGFFAVWADRFAMNQDGVSYLDISDAFMRGDWSAGINAHWSPLYPILLGVGRMLLSSSPDTDFAVAHLINFIIYLGAIASFDFLLREVIRRNQADDETNQNRSGLPAWAWTVLGFTLFIWSTLAFIPLRFLTPDLLVAALTYFAAALTLRINRKAASLPTFALLGVVLALGYYAKAAMFPLAFVFLGINLFASKNIKRSIPGVALAAVVFLLLSSPLIIAISQQKQRLTFSDSGKLTYSWFVNGVDVTYWQGENKRLGTPAHPLNKLSDNPPVYEYGAPIGGTYPVWYDPSYWYEGITPRFDTKAQVTAVTRSLTKYYKMFVPGLQISLFIGLLILLFSAQRRIPTLVANVAAQWKLIVLAVAGFAMYGLIYTETRYTGAFYVLLWLGLFSAVRLARTPRTTLLMRVTIIVVAATLLFMSVIRTTPNVYATVRGGATLAHPQRQVVEDLRNFGIRPGDAIAMLHPGDVLGSQSRIVALARLAGVRIVAGFRPEDASAFWSADEQTKANIMQALSRADARAILVENPPLDKLSNGWQRAGNSNIYVFILPK